MKTNLFAIKDVVNIKKIKDLFYFIFNNKKNNKISLVITNLVERKIVLISFLDNLVYNLFLNLL